VFGPGNGEAIAVHLGAGDWIVIDSCVDGRTGENALLRYFSEMGIDMSQSVRRVVATHAHDDHMAGMSDVVAACSNALFVWSSALSAEEFFSLAELQRDSIHIRPTIIAEYTKVVEILKSRATSGAADYPYINAIQTREIFSRDATATIPAARVVCLSPSDAAVDRSRKYVAKVLRYNLDGKGQRIPRDDPNAYSIALWIQVGDAVCILGSDLTKGPGPFCGWNAVVGITPRYPPASLYKVAHHGSKYSIHPRIWQDLLEPDSLAVLAPKGGKKGVPDAGELEVLAQLSAAVYLTAAPSLHATSRSVKKAAAELNNLATGVTEEGLAGHVRLRRDVPGQHWSVDTWHPARQI